MLKQIAKKLYFIFMGILTKISPYYTSYFHLLIWDEGLPNIKQPKTINEKLMFVKLFEDDHLKSYCADKYLVRNYVKSKGLEDILIPKIDVIDDWRDIDISSYGSSYVMKGTHGSKCNFICHNEYTNQNKVKKMFKRWMKTDYSSFAAEMHYRRIKPRIIIEENISKEGDPLIDYKIHCFHGSPKFVNLVLNQFTEDRALIYCDLHGNILPYNHDSHLYIENVSSTVQLPKNFNKMLKVAKTLSEEFNYVRVDLYSVHNCVYFGELTFTPSACRIKNLNFQSQLEMGQYLDIEKVVKKDTLPFYRM